MFGTVLTDMVLSDGKSPNGTEKIVSLWATNRNVPQIGFAPDWTKKGVMHFAGTDINDNLANKAKKLGIPV